MLYENWNEVAFNEISQFNTVLDCIRSPSVWCSGQQLAITVCTVISCCVVVIIVSHPLLSLERINERAVCNAIAPEKDVDGFHIVNIGKLCLDQRSMVPATPAAVWEIIKRAGKPQKPLQLHYPWPNLFISAIFNIVVVPWISWCVCIVLFCFWVFFFTFAVNN